MYSESRVLQNGVRKTFINFEDSCINISESLDFSDEVIYTEYRQFLPEPKFQILEDEVLVSCLGCPIVLNKSVL